jgi:hypothetical protein
VPLEVKLGATFGSMTEGASQLDVATGKSPVTPVFRTYGRQRRPNLILA